MKKNKNTPSFTVIGSPSLLVVFLVLCLTTFAILSLSSAKSDYSFTKRLADHKSSYYAAASQAEEIAADIDALLESTYRSKSMTQEEYLNALNPTLLAYEPIALSYSRENGIPMISYNIPVDDSQSLFVALTVTDPRENPHYYEIETWQLTSRNAWESDDTLKLMPMN